jgi:hypothetical protein
MRRLTLVATLALASVALAHAAPQSINDCEKIADPDAYNRCLADFGPAAHEHHVSQDGPGASPVAASPEQTGRRYGRHAGGRHRGGHVASRGHGRVRMVIQMGNHRQR